MKYFLLTILILIINCSLRINSKKTVLQGEKGNLELTISSNLDSISQNEIENLRINISLKNNYPFDVQSSKYVNFVECEIFRNDKYFYTIDKAVGRELEYLEPLFTEVFFPDTTVTAILYLNILEICNKKNLSLSGTYRFQGYYGNKLTHENSNIPIWIGSTTSNNKMVVIY